MHYFSTIIIRCLLAMFPTSGGQPTSAHWLARETRLMPLPATCYMQEASMLAAYFQDCRAQKMLQRYMASMLQMPLSVCEFALHHLCDKRLTDKV